MWELGNVVIRLTCFIRMYSLLAKNGSGWAKLYQVGIIHSMMSHEYPAASWYALATRSRQEKLVRDRLAGRGFEQLLPLIRRLSQWSDRKMWIDAPLFSGFCFARFSLNDKLAVLTLPGVVRIVGCNGPEAIPDEEMISLQKLAVCGLEYEPHQYCEEGMLVEVVAGPLAGVRGTLVRKAGRDRVVIRVRLIQQCASVQVARSTVRPVCRPDNLLLSSPVSAPNLMISM